MKATCTLIVLGMFSNVGIASAEERPPIKLYAKVPKNGTVCVPNEREGGQILVFHKVQLNPNSGLLTGKVEFLNDHARNTFCGHATIDIKTEKGNVIVSVPVAPRKCVSQKNAGKAERQDVKLNEVIDHRLLTGAAKITKECYASEGKDAWAKAVEKAVKTQQEMAKLALEAYVKTQAPAPAAQ